VDSPIPLDQARDAAAKEFRQQVERMSSDLKVVREPLAEGLCFCVSNVTTGREQWVTLRECDWDNRDEWIMTMKAFTDRLREALLTDSWGS
jgi:hypothetical protein